MADLKARQDVFQAIAAKHQARTAAVAAVLDAPTLAQIAKTAEAHGALHLEGLLAEGADPEAAVTRALQETSRHEEYLKSVHLLHADPPATATLFCAHEGAKTVHVLTTDQAGETVATCKCGRFKKFAAGVEAA